MRLRMVIRTNIHRIGTEVDMVTRSLIGEVTKNMRNTRNTNTTNITGTTRTTIKPKARKVAI